MDAQVYLGAEEFDQTRGSWWHEEAHADVPIAMMIIDITIHDKMSTTWQNKVDDEQLRETV